MRVWSTRVRAPFGVTGTRRVHVAATNGAGRARNFVDIAVKPVVWKPTLTWSEGPGARDDAAVILDRSRDRVIVIGGRAPSGKDLDDVWAWSLRDKTWSRPRTFGYAIPASGRRAAMAPDGNAAYLFGGSGEAGNELIRVTLGEAIVFDAIRHAAPIPARTGHSFVATPEGFIVFGGASTEPLNDTWSVSIAGDLAIFVKLATVVAPSPRHAFSYGGDARRLILFGGAQSTTAANPATDTWAFDFAKKEWAQIAVSDANAPTARSSGCYAFDAKEERLFVFGGTAGGSTAERGLFALDARDGHESWTKLDRPGEPLARPSEIGFYDPRTRSVTCGLGSINDWTSFGP